VNGCEPDMAAWMTAFLALIAIVVAAGAAVYRETATDPSTRDRLVVAARVFVFGGGGLAVVALANFFLS
jgi:uncharacterized membrane protein